MRYLILYVLIFNSNLFFSQSLRGRVVDQNGVPLQFASILVPKYSSGTQANSIGEFIIYKCKINDTIIIAHIGFKPDTVLLHDFSDLKITLTPIFYNLNEIVISNLTAKEVVEKAIKSIAKNYFFINNNVEGFYRELLFTNDSLSLMSESQLLVSFPENSNKKGKIKVLKKRSFKENSNNYMINGPLSILEMNEIFNKYVFSGLFFEFLNFELKGSYFSNKQKHQLIIFNLENPVNSMIISGEMSVNMEDFGINYLKIKVENLAEHKITETRVNFKKINEKYILESFIQVGEIIKKQKKTKKSISVKIQYSTTKYFYEDTQYGNVFLKGDNLENFENNYDERYWEDINHILIDSLLLNQITTLVYLSKNDLKNDLSKKNKAIYTPSFNYEYSIKGFNDVESLTFNLIGLNRLVYYYSTKKIKNGIARSLFQQLWAFFSITFQEVEAERRLYSNLGYKIKYNPILINPFYKTYSYGLSENDLNNAKHSFPSDFVRTQTIRFETNSVTIKKMEEELFDKKIFDNHKNIKEFLNYYFMEYFTRKILLSWEILFSGIDKNYPSFSDESKLPFSFNSINSYVKNIFNPDMPINRNILKSDLSDKENSYAKRIRWLSTLNFISAFP